MIQWLKKLHKWISLLIGIQVLLWLISGLMLSQLDPQKVSGKQWVQPTDDDESTIQAGKFFEPNQLAAEQLNGVLSISLETIRGEPVYRLRQPDRTILVNAVDGSIISTDAGQAEKLARRDFNGKGVITTVESGQAPDLETRNSSGPYWRVNFSDKSSTSIYISAATGEILARRNNYWRTFDFFWMLHIMDYSGHEDINNVLIIFVALIAIWLGISGFVLLFGSFSRHDFYFLNILGKTDTAVITLIDETVCSTRRVRLRKGSNLFLSLATHDISVPSVCGGGGECGKCRVKFEGSDIPEANPVETGLVPRRLREQGYRLACQHEVTQNATLQLPKGILEPTPSKTA